MKNQKGITLIALVITIIVLLILAGVAIAMLSGENGILNRSKDASNETVISTAKEQMNMAVNEGMTEYYAKKYSDENTSAYTGSIISEIEAVIGDVKWENGVTATKATASSGLKYTVKTKAGDLTAVISDTGALTWE